MEIDLYEAMLSIKNKNSLERFLKDLMTPQEIANMQERWKISQLLYYKNLSYREIHKVTGASLVTIGRVARFLKEEKNLGYIELLEEYKNGAK